MLVPGVREMIDTARTQAAKAASRSTSCVHRTPARRGDRAQVRDAPRLTATDNAYRNDRGKLETAQREEIEAAAASREHRAPMC